MSSPDLCGEDIHRMLALSADYVVVGSGPAGSLAAAKLSKAGFRVIIIDEGPRVAPEAYTRDALHMMIQAYRGASTTLSRGKPPMPIVQARVVGGGSVINGAISWPLPADILEAWQAHDPGIAKLWTAEALASATQEVETRLGIAPTAEDLCGENSKILARGAEALGLEHRPTFRNAPGCRGSGRCLQGCPNLGKSSMDRTFLADALANGAQLLTQSRALRIVHNGERAAGIHARTSGGATLKLRASKGVLLAASATGTPVLLAQSRIRLPHLGRHFQAHPGAGVLGRFEAPVRCWEGATQGHEVTGLRHERLKFEALGLDRGMLISRLPGVGRVWQAQVETLAHWASVGVALRARSEGRVSVGRRGQPVVSYRLDPEDIRDLAKGIAWAGRMLFAAGAREVLPGIDGFATSVTDPVQLDALITSPPRNPYAYHAVCTHLFGTTRAASEASQGIVQPSGELHAIKQLFVVDSSVFPTNTGVNPQTSILALASVMTDEILRLSP